MRELNAGSAVAVGVVSRAVGLAWRVACCVLMMACGRGTEWVRADSKTSQPLEAVHGSGPADVWAVGALGTAIHWDGKTWSAVESGTRADLNAVWVTGPGDAWAVGEQGVVLHWDGTRWTRVDVGTTWSLTSVWASGPGDVWIAPNTIGSHGVLHYDGKTWSLSAFPSSASAPVRVWGSGPRDVWTTQEILGSELMHWTGERWSEVPVEAGSYPDCGDLWGTGPGELWALCDLTSNTRVVHRSADGWRVLPAEIPDDILQGYGWTALWASSGGKVWTVGRLGVVFHYDGRTWHEEEPEDLHGGLDLKDVWGASETDLWAVGQGGVVLRRTPPASP